MISTIIYSQVNKPTQEGVKPPQIPISTILQGQG